MRFFVCCTFLFCLLCLVSMSSSANRTRARLSDSLTIMSYNVENLFDTIDDVLTADDEFTPQGAKRWTKYRYHKKLQQLATVVSRVGGRHWPSLVCLVEVENAEVLNDLLRLTALGKNGYRYVVTHSQDPRGIDVAFLYRSQDLELIEQHEHTPIFTADKDKKSRNVLELRFRLSNSDELYVYGLHLPSRREGVKRSEPFRRDVAKVIRSRCDSIYRSLSLEKRRRTHFILMGDFNEEAHEVAIREDLAANTTLPSRVTALSRDLMLYSLLHPRVEPQIKERFPRGSYCYQRVWTQLDHFIISESLLKDSSGVRYISGSAHNYYAAYLASQQTVAAYPTPRRTYGGNHYLGGYSDHYPIVMRLGLE